MPAVQCASRYYGEHGVTTTSFLRALVFVSLLAALMIKLLPVYIEHFNVSASMDALSSELQGSHRSAAHIKRRLLAQFGINNVSLAASVIDVQSQGQSTQVIVDYEVRKALIGNIDMIIHFHDRVDL